MSDPFTTMTCGQVCAHLDTAKKALNLTAAEVAAIENAETIVRNAWGLHAKGDVATALEMCNRMAELEL